MSTNAINLIGKLVPTRAHIVAWVAACVAAVIVAFVPLFNVVGYESAALFGVVLGLCATGLTVYAVQSGLVEAPLGEERTTAPLRDFGRLAVVHLAMAAGPLAILSLNALRVPNCDWGWGLAFWALIVAPAILIGQTAGWAAAALLAGRRIAVWVGAFGILVVDAVSLGVHLALEPPIVGHQWLLGYFGGSIYDEALAIPDSLIAYRVLNLLAVVAVVAAIQAVFDWRRRRVAGWTAGVVAVALLASAAGFGYRAEFGIAVDRDYIVDQLGGTVETEHFVIHYPKTSRYIERLDEMVEDHEYRYEQMREFFGTDPVAESGQKVRSFVYADRDSKGDLMGGRDTMVAKLWLHEMHILWNRPGGNMLAHELAHIFTEPFGAGPLSLSMQWGVGVNMGLVEGIAVAAEWPLGEMTPHEAAAAMRRLDIDPQIERIVGAGGFWTEASGPAYVAMGSFVRFLVDEEGIEPFKQAYPRGDFEGAYGVEIDELVDRWEQFVDEVEVTDRQEVIAEHRYDRPPIFGRDCARTVAEVRRLARAAANRGAFAEARAEYERLKRLDPNNPTPYREYARLLLDHHRHEEALQVVEQVPEESASRLEEGRVRELEGDILWSKGQPERAAQLYEEVLDTGTALSRERQLRLKRRFAERDDERARELFVERPGRMEGMYLMMNWRRTEPDEPVAAYLVGRRLWQRGLYDRAIPHLEHAQARMEAEALDAEALRMLGESYHFERRFDDALEVWDRLGDSTITHYVRRTEQWRDRLEHARGGEPE